jgi:hypothetical protein
MNESRPGDPGRLSFGIGGGDASGPSDAPASHAGLHFRRNF